MNTFAPVLIALCEACPFLLDCEYYLYKNTKRLVQMCIDLVSLPAPHCLSFNIYVVCLCG